jgi:hypothetical protein
MIPVNTVRIVSIAMRLISVTAFAENGLLLQTPSRATACHSQTTELVCAIRRSDLSVLRTPYYE